MINTSMALRRHKNQNPGTKKTTRLQVLSIAALLCCLLSVNIMYAQCPPDDGNGTWQTGPGNQPEDPKSPWNTAVLFAPSTVKYTYCYRCNTETGLLEIYINSVQVAPNPVYDQDQYGDNDMPHWIHNVQEELASRILSNMDGLLDDLSCGLPDNIPHCGEVAEDGSDVAPVLITVGVATCIGEIEAFDPFLGTDVRYAFPCQSGGTCKKVYSACWQEEEPGEDHNGDGKFEGYFNYITSTTEYDGFDCPDKCTVIGEDGFPHEATSTYRMCGGE
jgi:hypothetical protein